jgi:hypothetical protein
VVFRYKSLSTTIAKKFTKRRHKSDVGDGKGLGENRTASKDLDTSAPDAKKLKSKKKFLKPKDD